MQSLPTKIVNTGVAEHKKLYIVILNLFFSK